jgi:hypothetical protein
LGAPNEKPLTSDFVDQVSGFSFIRDLEFETGQTKYDARR